MDMIRRFLAAALLVVALSADVLGGNASQTTIDNADCSGTIAITNTWQQIATRDNNRAKFLIMNVSTNEMGLFISRLNNNNAIPTPSGIGQPRVWTLTSKGSYEPDGGWIDGGEYWIIGTAGDNYTCQVSVRATP